MSFPAARKLRSVTSSTSSVSQQMKVLLCGASCLITALEWARMLQSSSSINITWQGKRHQFVKCKSRQCSSMSPSLFCQVPCRPKDSKWVPIHILFSSFSHLSCFLTDCKWGNTIYTIYIFPINVERCIFFAFGMCALSPKWLWQVFCVQFFYYLLNQQNSFSLSCFIMQPVRGRTNHVTIPMATELYLYYREQRTAYHTQTNICMSTHSYTHTYASTSPQMLLLVFQQTHKHTPRHIHCWKSGCLELWMKQYCNLNLYGTFPLWVQPMNYPLQ